MALAFSGCPGVSCKTGSFQLPRLLCWLGKSTEGRKYVPFTNGSLVAFEDRRSGLVFRRTDSLTWIYYLRQAKGIESAAEIVLMEKMDLGVFLDSAGTVNCVMWKL